ncbi:MAG: peptidase C39 [Clostridiales Family XIII bacterium]|jgi:hypothetical protein|nr:peptidase C39 [Clostridiales Family XIII bacterium]
MDNPLAYQRTEYDCGPTTLLNALTFLFRRGEIPPDLLKFVTIYATDGLGAFGQHGRGGTSMLAMMFVSGWLNEYARSTGFPVSAEYVTGAEAPVRRGSRASLALQEGGVVIARVMHEEDEHYILLTGIDGEGVYAWDPYYAEKEGTEGAEGVLWIGDQPCKANRLVPLAQFVRTDGYALYRQVPPAKRESVIVFNTSRRPAGPTEPEYTI